MSFCRKCGARGITRRRAGVFSCNHCGVMPGSQNLDRSGNPMTDDNETHMNSTKDNEVSK